MVWIPKKTVERLNKTVGKFQKVLSAAKNRDVNEADTVSIIADMLAEVFGFDKYLEVTSEFAIRNTYCDLAIKANGKIQYIIEVKAVGLDLHQHHLRQAVEYGANHGVQWVVLTNGISWEIYRIRFEKPISTDLICSFNFLEINPKKVDNQEKLFLLCKKGLSSEAREGYYEYVQCVNRFMIGAIILGDATINTIKRELKKLSSGLKIENPEIEKILQSEVLKRDVLEGDEASKAKGRIKRLQSKSAKKPIVSKPTQPEPQTTPESNV
ncbi:MAG: type I restriction enzyme HsdR N-terminal domain-containing protein [Thermodesulfobacteriota bacterium]